MNTLYKICSEDEKELFRNWLVSMLKFGKTSVTFIKKDGTQREMLCTLKADGIQEYEKKTDRERKSNDEVCSVFDVDKQAWRSFRYDSVTQVSFSLSN